MERLLPNDLRRRPPASRDSSREPLRDEAERVVWGCLPPGQCLGEERLKALFARAGEKGADALHAAILEALDRFVGGRPQSDDVTFVIVERSPAGVGG